ncbi:MAG: TolC family protein [Chitinophagia bacterium]|nr:TolC family protein [Chitinophagia bacterium]
MKRFLIIPCMLISSCTLFSQVTVKQDVKDLIRKSFTFFPVIKEKEQTLVTAKEKMQLTELNKYPDITADAGYTFVQPKIELPINGEKFQFAPVHNLTGSINATYALFDFGRLKAAVERSKKDIQLAQHQVEFSKCQLAYQVATIYYNILYLQKAIAIEDSLLVYLQENKQLIQTQLSNGTALKIDALSIQAAIDNENNRRIDLANTLQKQVNLMEYTTGTSTKPTSAGFDFQVSTENLLQTLALAQQQNPEFSIAKDKVQQSNADLAIAQLADKPMIGVRAGAGIRNGYVPYVNDLRFNYLAGLSFTVPIYNGGKAKQQQKLQQQQIVQQELAIETLNNQYKKDLMQALADVNSAKERIKNTEGQIQQTKAAEKLAYQQMKNGVGTHLEITQAGNRVQQASFTRLQYEYQLCLSQLELARLMGIKYWEL